MGDMTTKTAVAERAVPFDLPISLLKAVEEDGEFHIVGYAATTDFDLQGDVITEEALSGSAADLLKNSTVLLNHDLKRPIGRAITTRQIVLGNCASPAKKAGYNCAC